MEKLMETVMALIVLLPFAGAVVTWFLGCVPQSETKESIEKRNFRRNAGAALTVGAELALALTLYLCREAAPDAQVVWSGICGVGLSFHADGFQGMYALIAAFMWFVCTVFSFSYMKHYKKQNRYYFFLLMTLGATQGVFLSQGIFTLFVFFEIMSLASYVWVAQDEESASLRAAETYLAIAVMGGLCILMGMFLLYGIFGPDILYSWQMNLAGADRGRLTAAGILLLLGFGAKAGAVPLHIWLPKAHPVAPAPASALLSGVLTKTGVYGVMLLTLQLFWGELAFGRLIFVLGILTMVTGAVLAVFSVDLKRTLACSSVSQIGFVFAGLGMAGMCGAVQGAASEGYELSLWGMELHMVNHSLLKLLLFCGAGVVFMNLHKLNLNDIKGYGRRKPLLKLMFLFGALGLAGVPLFNGYVSKSLIHEGIVYWQEIAPSLWMKTAEWLFIISGGLTAAYMTKLYVALFVEKNKDVALQEKYDGDKRYMNIATTLLLGFTAVLLPVIGVGTGVHYGLFEWESISGALVSLVIGAAVYLLVIRKWLMRDGEYLNRWNPKLDLETLIYRPLLGALDIAVSAVCRLFDRLPDYIVVGLRRTVFKDSPLPHELEEGNALTHTVGAVLDDGRELLNHTVRKDNPVQSSYEHRLAMAYEEFKENNTMIARSLSFGLLLFCIGLLFTLLYMLMM